MAGDLSKKIFYDQQSYLTKKSEFQTLLDDIEAQKKEINNLTFTTSTGPAACQMRSIQSTLGNIVDNMFALVDTSIAYLDRIVADIEQKDS